MKHDTVTPYHNKEEKKDQVAQMFNNIAGRYDFLNSFLSLGIHKGWRKKCVKALAKKQPESILDVATGTADFAIACAGLKPKEIIGIDISDGMMEVGRKKISELGLSQLIKLENGNAETLAFADNTFDAIVVGFGVRNFQDLEKGLKNLLRILKPGGQIVILEFSYPKNWFIKFGYTLYFSYITPFIGRLFSNDKRAYSYLTESVKAFPHNEDFVKVMQNCAYKNTSYQGLTFGVAAMYIGEK